MITKQQIIRWLETSAETFNDKKAYLTELDSAVGDADHGINMARGFNKVVEKLPSYSDTDIGNILKSTGMTLISSVGGASGPLYGTFFMRAAQAVPSKHELDSDDMVRLFESGLEGLIQRGRAELGEKTMIDAMSPAVDAMREKVSGGAGVIETIDAGVQAAEKGVEATVPMVAKKGRASYLGERSVGHQDPGATSVFYLLSVLADVVKQPDEQ